MFKTRVILFIILYLIACVKTQNGQNGNTFNGDDGDGLLDAVAGGQTTQSSTASTTFNCENDAYEEDLEFFRKIVEPKECPKGKPLAGFFSVRSFFFFFSFYLFIYLRYISCFYYYY